MLRSCMGDRDGCTCWREKISRTWGRIQRGRRRWGKIIAGFLVWGIGYTVTPLRLAIRERCDTGMNTRQEVQKMTDLIGGL